ncbi:MAG: arylesterase [Alphaproteobacteria bacterium]|nr:arylesterase [Alphaproteobacteria bacterium]
MSVMTRISIIVSRAMALLLVLLLAGCGPSEPQLAPLPKNGVILAFGDSLTYGTGAKPQDSYPAVLTRLTGRRVIRSGVPGEVSARGLARLPEMLDRHRPNLLILCHGGNDFLRRHRRDGTEANIRAMVELARARNIDVVLIGVPAPGLWITEGAELFARVAKAHGIPYEAEALAAIVSNGSLKSDTIHPNAKGYRKLAEAVAALLRASGAL